MVLADSAFGDNLQFRLGVRALHLHYIVGVHLTTCVRILHKRQLQAPQRIEQILHSLPAKAFRRYKWRQGSRGKLSARFAFFQVHIDNDPTGQSQWLILEWRDDEDQPSRAHLSSLPPSTRRPRLVYLLKERYRTEQTYRELKQDLGLDKYEGRKWQGFAHHVSVVLSCYAFLVAEREGVFPPGAQSGRRGGQALPLESPSPGAHR